MAELYEAEGVIPSLHGLVQALPGGWMGVISAALIFLVCVVLMASRRKSSARSTTRFKDVFFSREHRYSLGVDQKTGGYYLSIPVRNPYIEYDEYYAISEDEFTTFQTDPTEAADFAVSCGRREQDNRLIQKPGKYRGSY